MGFADIYCQAHLELVQFDYQYLIDIVLQIFPLRYEFISADLDHP